MTLPNFLVIGAQRAGTTWLDAVLRSHPSVFMPADRKEVHFFDRFYDRGVDWYRAFFPDRETEGFRAIGENTPAYLAYPEVPDRIERVIPDCRFIVILRNPVDRAYSEYGLAVMAGAESRSFEEVLDANASILERGMYSKHLSRYFERFGRERVCVLICERIVNQPLALAQRLGVFLSLDASEFDTNVPRANESMIPRFPLARSLARTFGRKLRSLGMDSLVEKAKELGLSRAFGNRGSLPKMRSETREWLREFYAPELTRLEGLLQERIPEWHVGRNGGFPDNPRKSKGSDE